ncbi:hypothetical protein [Anaeromyxobacter oryzae]|uniref:Uncharacterized protein n=1 Tax=Anaeromyxobacter oryzae TaxID=2918170 RepID=A0ABN6N1H6_9BACT|nr:hypothetical protein [Anaeromyxobacter oryzae]BDG05857.1 hypothetical protein AMOR_48530 [Anaeromyxobacter oryzae]
MPVSKKRKKDGKPVHMTHAPAVHGEEHAHGPDAKPEPGPVVARKSGKPSNPFVAQAQSKRGAQRGR